MPWLDGIACFFGGVFLANALPHLIAGVSGRSMPTPFASPPFRGLSSPVVNVAWALVNLAVAWVLAVWLGGFELQRGVEVAVGFGGFGGMAMLCARSVARSVAAGR